MKISEILRAASEHCDGRGAVYGACWSIQHCDPSVTSEFLDRYTPAQQFFKSKLKPARTEEGYSGEVYWWNIDGRAGIEVRVIALLLAAEVAESEGL